MESKLRTNHLALGVDESFFLSLLYFFHYHSFPYTTLPPAITTLLSMSRSPFSFLLHPSIPSPHHPSCHPALHLWVCPHFSYYFTSFIRFHIWVKSYGICLSLTGLFHLAYALQIHPYCHKGWNFSSFLQLSSISLCTDLIVVLSTHLLMEIGLLPYIGDCK